MAEKDNLKIIQWNICGLRSKTHHIRAAAEAEDVDIFLLQETKMPNTIFRLSGYQVFLTPQTGGTNGLATLVKNTLPAIKIADTPDCGEGNEVLGVRVTTRNNELAIYNVYRKANTDFIASELLSTVYYDTVLIGGDFNAHHPQFNPNLGKINAAGRQIVSLLEHIPEVTLATGPEATHIQGGTLDLTLVSTDLYPKMKWSVHPTLTSDHFAVNITLEDSAPEYFTLPPPKWNIKHINWPTFQQELDTWSETYITPDDINEAEKNLVQAFHAALNKACPVSSQSNRHYKDHWFYDDEVKELYARVNSARKRFRRQRTEDNKELLQAAVRSSDRRLKEIRREKWLEWCSQLNAHTSLARLWDHIRRVTGKTRTRAPLHPTPQVEAERLATLFRDRASSAQLPTNTRRRQDDRLLARRNTIATACQQPSPSDVNFTLHELLYVEKTGKDTAPGDDRLTYLMIKNSGEAAKTMLLALINATWRQGQLPDTWKTANVTPIPKPKDPGNPRPIHLLSCLGKTAEKLVRRRLEHQVGQLHPHLFAYRRGVGTTENLAGLLSTVDGHPSVVVFLDLEKAFELVNPMTILETLALKGVQGRLLKWIQGYITGRHLRVTFQGKTSLQYSLENGTPQGGILSPILFNLVMERLVSIDFERGVKLLCYADDLQLISQGNAKHRKAQAALLKIEQMCTELGLKINPLKTKAMLIKERRIPEGNLRIQDTDIEWVQKHQCLGIHFDYRLSFKPQVEYLKERMATRINAMKGMTALSSGADYDVLRSYYVHAVRSLIDYSSIALVGLNPTELHALQVQQNKAMRLIVGAPIWTKLSNLQVETGIAPVEARITKNVAAATAKLLTTPGYPLTRSRLRTAAAQGEQFDTTRWTRKANTALSSSGLRYVGALDEDTACEGYTEPPPWTENHTVYSCKLPEAPRDDTVRRRIHGELQIARLTINDAAVFYTDGSVDEDGRSGAAFIYNGEQFLTRLSDGCSSMQAEMVAIQQATAHATTLPNTDIIIHTDSQSAMEALQARNLKDNIRLTTTVKRNIRELQRQRKTVTINWIPSHVGIHGNESADMAAKTAALLAEVTTHVQPSLSAMKMAARRRETTITTNRNRTYAAEGSRSCQWYRGVTDGKRLRIPRGTPRTLRVHLHRLRLGYVCNWRIRQQEVRPCAHCGVHQEEPLLHWVLQCDKTEQLRHQLSTHHMNPHDIEARGTAVRMLKTLFSSHMDILTNTIQQYPPPR